MTVGRAITGAVGALRLLCTLILLTLAVTPTLDGLICAGEGAPFSSALIATTIGDAAGGDLDHGICAHGHGHCAAAIAPRSATTVATFNPKSLDRRWPMMAVLSSAPSERLERPPRA